MYLVLNLTDCCWEEDEPEGTATFEASQRLSLSSENPPSHFMHSVAERQERQPPMARLQFWHWLLRR